MIPLEHVDGLNVSEGLERCMNDRDLYRTVLLEFRAGYGDMAARLAALLAAGKWSDAETLTHAAKGTTGMLSANDLYAATSILDATLKRAIKAGGPPPDLQSDLERFQRELARLIAGINQLAGD
jgi:HPt (histidine-containing phosphotransfer) domain-containing protein